MRKLRLVAAMFREILLLVREHRAWFLAPLLLSMAALSLLVYYVGPTVIITFIYAGV